MKHVLLLLTAICCFLCITTTAQQTTANPNAPRGNNTDTDGDGVPDSRDKELITPTYCQPVDADGVGKCPCPEGCTTPVTATARQAASVQDRLIQQETEITNLKLQITQLVKAINSISVAIPTEGNNISLRAFSITNPAQHYFTILTQSSDNKPITIRVMDSMGKLLEQKAGLSANSTFELGRMYRSGSYVVEVIQGNKKATLKLIKQAD